MLTYWCGYGRVMGKPRGVQKCAGHARAATLRRLVYWQVSRRTNWMPPRPISLQKNGAVAVAGRSLRCPNTRAVLDSRLPNLGLAARGVVVFNPAPAQPPERYRPPLRVPSRVRPSSRRRQRDGRRLLGRQTRRAPGLAQSAGPRTGMPVLRQCAGDSHASFRRQSLRQSRSVLRQRHRCAGTQDEGGGGQGLFRRDGAEALRS